MKITILSALIASLTTMPVAQADPVSLSLFKVKRKDVKAQDTATGFVNGQYLSGVTRNWYSRERATKGPIYRHYEAVGSKSYSHNRDNWVQSIIVDYSSGFTQGTIGIAAQVAVYSDVALERDRESIGGPNNRTLTDSTGDVEDQWSKVGLANIKARVADTTLTLGRQAVNTPVLAIYGNRSLPSSFEGASLTSNELDTMSFQAGVFDRVSPRTEQSQKGLATKYGSLPVETNRISMLGVDYTPSANLRTSLYTSELKDIWRQYYFGIKYRWADIDNIRLNSVFSYYRSQDQGQAILGAIDNNAYSFMLTAGYLAHSITFSWQQVIGDEYFDVVGESGANYLAHVLYSDYSGPNEKSMRIGYDFDMGYFGVPGLMLNVYTARGWGIDGTHYKGTGYNVRNLDDEHHYEVGVGAGYTVNSGGLKGASIKTLYWVHRASANQIDGNVNELRIVTIVPF
ncbi:OprD family porin [Pseudomonas sp. Marseille-Q5117]|uniref:OprD family porin n=1 Tax=Pseudomonas sp. Marseille-Q5117 TaxID=2972777 RepID=UPI0021CA6C26|nr:OprD family porin [Pseudomonas sp. Marseille-Q5117]